MACMGRILLRLIGVCSLILSFLLVKLVQRHITFEHALDTLTISFDSFDPSYSQALIDSTSKHEILYYFFHRHSTASETPSLIPPTIHFIWFRDLYPERPDSLHVPSSGSDTPALCRKYNPAFDIRIWNASAARLLVEQDYPWLLPTYDGFRYPIQRVDALKYLLLFHFGGVYLDLEVSCRRALDPLLEFPAWFPRAKPLGVNNDVMAARKGHPLLEKMIHRLEARDKNLISPWLTIFWSTGPRFVTDLLREWLARDREPNQNQLEDEGSGVGYDPDAFVILPAIFYSEEYTFFGHRPGGSWYGWDVAVVQWCLARPYIFLLPICASLVVALWYRRRSMRDHRAAWSRKAGV